MILASKTDEEVYFVKGLKKKESVLSVIFVNTSTISWFFKEVIYICVFFCFNLRYISISTEAPEYRDTIAIYTFTTETVNPL